MHMNLGRFITVDADVELGDAIDLVRGIGPSYVVIQATPTLEDEQDDDLYFVLSADDIMGRQFEGGRTLRHLLLDEQARPVQVMGFTRGDVHVPQREELFLAAPPRRSWLGMRRMQAPPPPIVLVDEGIVSAVMPPGTPASPVAGADRGAARGGGGAGDEADGDDGGTGPLLALAVAIDYARKVALDTRLSLLISLTRDTAVGDAIPIAAEIGDVIDIVVSPRSGFVVSGSPDGQLRVTDDAESLPIQVKLLATELGPGLITVYAFREGNALGSLTISPDVVAPGTQTGPQTRETRGLGDARPAEADLVLLILEQRDHDGEPELEFRLTAKNRELGLNLKRFGPVPLKSSPGAYFTDLFTEIEQLPVDTRRQQEVATERLGALGADLFSTLFPADLRVLLWGLQERITSVLIQSDEAWVPWEICRLVTERDGRFVEGPFFCEAFEVTRWVPGEALIGQLTMEEVGLIVPPDSGLLQAANEAAMVHGLASDTRSVVDIPPNYLDVRKAFSDAVYDAVHFVGHGAFPDPSNPSKAEISLSGNHKLRPTDLAGAAANLGLKRPLVFFNACQAGRGAIALTGVGGWATAMVRAGVGAFVGTHWEVTDTLAATFAERFYQALDAGLSIGAATRDARLAIKGGDPTWLAYTVFAEPTVTLGASDGS